MCYIHSLLLISIFADKIAIAKDYLLPTIKLAKDGKIPESNALDFVKLKYQHILKSVFTKTIKF